MAQVQNGICAQGYVKEVSEGGWGTNDLYVQLEFTEQWVPPTWWHPSTSAPQFAYIRFRDTLDPTRFSAIRTLVHLAMANHNKVRIRTSSVDGQNLEDCTRADEIILFNVTGN